MLNKLWYRIKNAKKAYKAQMRRAILRKFFIISFTVYVCRYFKSCISVTNKMSMFFTSYSREHFDYTFLEEKVWPRTLPFVNEKRNCLLQNISSWFPQASAIQKEKSQGLEKVLVTVDVYIWWPIFICSSL